MKISCIVWAVVFISMLSLRLDAAQVAISAAVSGEHSPFQARSTIRVDFSGIKHDMAYNMIDENGFEYDTMRMLLYQDVRTQLEIDNDQYAEIYDIWEERKQKLSTMLGKEILGASLDDEQLKHLAQEEFLESEDRMRKVLTTEQINGLELARVQVAVERHGAAKALAASDLRERFGLTDSDLESIGEGTQGLEKQVASYRADELKQANKKLLAKVRKLMPNQDRELEEFVSESKMESFLATHLFQDNNPKKKPRIVKPDITRMVKLISVRKKAKITDQQFEQLMGLRKELRENPGEEPQTQNRLAEILDDEQCLMLNQMVVYREFKRLGTVNAVGRGFMAERLGLSKDEAKEILEFGAELQESLNENVAFKKTELLRESMTELPTERRQAVIESLGTLSR